MFKIYVGADTPIAFFADIPSFTDRQQLVAHGDYPELIGQWEGVDVCWDASLPPAGSVDFLYGYLYGYLRSYYAQTQQEAIVGASLLPLTTPTDPLSDGLSRTLQGP